MLHLFSSRPDLVIYGQQRYRAHSRDASTLINQLLLEYVMSPASLAKLQDFNRNGIQRMLKEASKEQLMELFKWFPVEEWLERVPVEERLAGVPVEERLAGYPLKNGSLGYPLKNGSLGYPLKNGSLGYPLKNGSRVPPRKT